MTTAKEVSRLLAQQADVVARYLLPNGRKDNDEWRAGSIQGEIGRSLGVHLTGEKAGVWCDFASGEGGDLVDLWAAVRNLTLAAAIKEAARYLGVSQTCFEPQKAYNFARPSKKILSEINFPSDVVSYLTNERKLSIQTIHKFRIDEQQRKIIFPYIREDEIIFIKYLGLDRIDGKKQITAEKNCEPCLFGWHVISENSRTITLCEGEIDAMTLHQYGFPALSVPFGGGAGKKQQWIEYEFDRLAIYDEIYLCFDPDTEGKMAIAELAERLGRYRCRVVELPHKDPNACLQANVSKEDMSKCFLEARTLDPEELKRASSFADVVIDEFYPPVGHIVGYSPPWNKAKDKIIFRTDELTVWTGINGHGKSQVLGHVILSLMKQGAKICIASLELKPKRLLMRLTRQAGGIANPTENYIRAIHDWYGDQLWMFDLVGNAKSKRLLEVFLYARQRYGVNVFVIDSFMKLDIAEDDYKAQKAFMEQLCDFKNQHNCHIHIVVHPRKSLDETQAPGKLDNKGTGAISDLADNCLTVWRNKKKEELLRIKSSGKNLTSDQTDKLKEADCLLICDKQRNGDWEGRIGLWFDPCSFQYREYEDQKSIPYVEYSSIKL